MISAATTPSNSKTASRSIAAKVCPDGVVMPLLAGRNLARANHNAVSQAL